MCKSSIIKAEGNDADLLTNICFVSKKHWGYSDELMEMWRQDLTISETMVVNNFSFKMMLKSKTVGFIIVSLQDNIAEILHCCIAPAYIGLGFGSKLLSYVFTLNEFKGKSFEVTADPNAIPFYQKFWICRD